MTVESPLSFSQIIGFSFVAITLIVVTRLVIYLLKRMWRQQKYKLVWTPISSIERRSNLSDDEFFLKYATVGKPVIITDEMKDWKALTKWSLDFFKSEYGELIQRRVKDDKERLYDVMTIGDYIDYMTTNESDKPLYFANCFISYFPELLEDYKEPTYLASWLLKLPRKILLKYQFDNPEIFVGCKNTSVGLHKDPDSCAAWLAMISGRKQVILFSPDQEYFLYKGEVDAFNPDLEKFPLYAKAKPVEFTLQPGEILYIPPNWWHHIKNLENTISLGSLIVNKLNSEPFFQSFLEESPIKGHLVPLMFEFPWLSRVLFAVGII